jgi:hypothetical protein
VLFSEQAAERSWINLSDSYRFLADGSLIWWSERDGFGHLYRFRPDHYPDSQWQQLTQGDWVVTGLVGVDQKAGRVFFTGTKDGVLAQQVYALDLAAPSKIVRLTDPGFDNAATMDKRGQTLMVTRMPMRSRRSPTLPTLPASGSRGSRRIAWRDRTLRALSRQPSPGDLWHDPGRRWHAAALDDDHAAVGAWAQVSRLHLPLWRPARAGGAQGLAGRAGAGDRRQGLYLFRDRQPRIGQSRG